MSTNFTVEQNFSVYHQFIATRPVNIFSERRRMLARWCTSIERTVQVERFQTSVFAGFQQLSFFLPVAERYMAIAQRGNNVYVFGTPHDDLPQVDNLHFVHLKPDDQLVNEWFLVAHHSLYSRALIALETSTPGTPHKDRTFTGALTNDARMIAPVFYSLKSVVGESIV